jgi:hypothetical protein
MSHFDTIEFDLYVLEDPRTDRGFIMKMDCGFPCGSGDYPIETPAIGEWTSYSIAIGDLIAHPGSSLDTSSVDTPLVIFPNWGNQQGVVMQIDNVRLVSDGDDNNNPPTEIIVEENFTLFDDELAAQWSFFDCCGNANVSFANEGARGEVIIVDFFGPSPTVSGVEAALPHNFAALSGGIISFDLKLVSPSNDPTADYLIKLEGSDGSFRELSLSNSLEGVGPTVGQWQTYTFNVSDFGAAGLNIEKLNKFMIFPSWMRAQGAVYMLDNVQFSQ